MQNCSIINVLPLTISRMERKSIMAEHAKAKDNKPRTRIAQAHEMTRTREVLDRNGNVIKRTVEEPKK